MVKTRSMAIVALAAGGLAMAQTSFSPIRIKCAGPSYTDSQGYVWSAATGGAGGVPANSTVPIAGTYAEPLYQSWRSWNASASPGVYRFTVPNGTYNVVLKFAETSVTQTGQRIFHVRINDQTVLTNFDVLASAGGANIALDKQYTVAVSTGQLEIVLVSAAGAAMLSAIQVTETPAQSPYDVVAKFHGMAGISSFSLPDTPMIGTLRVYRNGLLLSDVGDYFLSDNQLWFQPEQALQATDLVQVIFKH